MPNNNHPPGSDIHTPPGGINQHNANDPHPHGGGGGGGGNGGGGKDKIDPHEIEQEYGISYQLFKHFPELYKLLEKAVANSWTAQRFAIEVRQTDWFKTHSSVWRTNIALKYSDPGDYKNKVGVVLSKVQNLAHQYGARMTGSAMQRLAERAFLLGMSDEQLMNILANHVLPGDSGHYGGDLSSIEEQLRNTALRNGVRINDGQLQRWMRNIVRGNANATQFEQHIRDVAAKMFPAYADQIRGNMDVADVAAPYMQSMASILDINPGSIDLYDRTIRKALQYRDDKGAPLGIADFEDQLRSDPRWQYTDNARDQLKGYAIALAKMWGIQS